LVEPRTHLRIAAILIQKGTAGDHSISDTECVSARVSNVPFETVPIFYHRQTKLGST
jgi:hypothetical protein